MRLFLATGPYYIILLFHLHTTSRVCNIIASGLTVPRSRIVMNLDFRWPGYHWVLWPEPAVGPCLVDVPQMAKERLLSQTQ
jgi:hypothetical protein